MNKVEGYFKSLETKDSGYWYPTCSFTLMHVNNEAFNKIPEKVDAVCDIRFPASFSKNSLIENISNIIGSKINLEVLITGEPTNLLPDPLFFEVSKEELGQSPKKIREHGGSDARFIAPYNIPVIMSRPYVGNIHTDNEWIDIYSMVKQYKIYKKYIEKKLLPDGKCLPKLPAIRPNNINA